MTPHPNDWLYTIGWTLVHFVWQGALIALMAAAVLAACRRVSSVVRYTVACIGLAVLLAAPIGTLVVLRSTADVPLPIENGLPVAGSRATASTGAALTIHTRGLALTAARTSAVVERWLPFVVWAWLCGVAVFLARFAGGSWRVRRLRLSTLEASISKWQPTGERLAERLGIRRAFRIVDSALVAVPSVIGIVRPVVLLPVAGLANLTPGQVEALIAHELAHIQRRDYAVNVAQTIAEALLFFHPAVWWMSARIREERENCCDDVALELCAEPVAYASALAELASWRRSEPVLSVGAADGALLARVQRILRTPDSHAPRTLSASIVFALGIVLAAGLAVQTSSQKPLSPPQSTAAKRMTVTMNNVVEEFTVKSTDHFQLFYQSDLDLHADRVAREAEAAYARVSDDLRHNLASSIPLFVLRTATQVEEFVRRVDLSTTSMLAGDVIMLPVDRPVEQWRGLITHEVAHVFGFDILPSKSIATWIREGLAEYERGTWEPNDLALLRDTVRANAVPAMSRYQDDGRQARLVSALGHAAFDFVEARSGKAGVRQLLFALRKTSDTGADPFQAGLQLDRDAFDRAFEAYLRQRFATVADAVAPNVSLFGDVAVILSIAGDVTATRWPAGEGLACIELWVPIGDGIRRQRWAVECAAKGAGAAVSALKPGDSVVVTGRLARGVTDQRVTLASVTRPADGFAWPVKSK